MHNDFPSEPSTVPEKPPVDNTLLTPTETAELLKISSVTLSRLVREGRLPMMRISRRIKRFNRADILAIQNRVEGSKN